MASSAIAGAADTPITVVHSDIIQCHILNRLDGSTLASTSCASAQLFALCNDDHLWRKICNSNWPSTADSRVRGAIADFSSGHRSFYVDSIPAVRQPGSAGSKACGSKSSPDTCELISAVDIHCDGELIYSKVIVTETLSDWFTNSPFRLDLLEPKETVETPLAFFGEDGSRTAIASDRLRLSWILIDPAQKRAVNIASRTAVDARRHWLTEDLQLRFATVVPGTCFEPVQFAVTMTCGGQEGGNFHVREVSMQVEDVEGKIVSGRDGLLILQDTISLPRRKVNNTREEKEMYGKFVSLKIQRREKEQRREAVMDMAFIAAGVCTFVAMWIYFLSR